MARGFYQQLTKLLKQHGCYFKREGKGDHEMWYSPVSKKTFTVDRKCLSRHTANGVLKEAGIQSKL